MSPRPGRRNPTLLEFRIPADEWNWNPLDLDAPFGVAFDIAVVTLAGVALPTLLLSGLALLFTGEFFSLEALSYISFFFGALALLIATSVFYFVQGRVHIKERGVKFGFPSDTRPGYWSWAEVKDFSLLSRRVTSTEDRSIQSHTSSGDMKEMILNTVYGAQLRRTIPNSVSIAKLRRLLKSQVSSVSSLGVCRTFWP